MFCSKADCLEMEKVASISSGEHGMMTIVMPNASSEQNSKQEHSINTTISILSKEKRASVL